jgi:hypothetical protein
VPLFARTLLKQLRAEEAEQHARESAPQPLTPEERRRRALADPMYASRI